MTKTVLFVDKRGGFEICVYLFSIDEDIARIGEAFGAEVIVRPTELAQDESPEWLAWQHAVNYLELN